MNGLWTVMTKKHPDQPTRGREPRTFAAKPVRKLVTSGSLRTTHGSAFIYVGVSAVGVKAGMTTDPKARASALKVRMTYVREVRAATAKEVETELFQILGHEVGDTEWTKADVSRVVLAAKSAFDRMQRRLWVDPKITEDDARKLRVRLAVDDTEAARIASIPDKRRGATLASFKRANLYAYPA